MDNNTNNSNDNISIDELLAKFRGSMEKKSGADEGITPKISELNVDALAEKKTGLAPEPEDTAEPEPEIVEPEADETEPAKTEPEDVEPESVETEFAKTEPEIVEPDDDDTEFAKTEPEIVEPEADETEFAKTEPVTVESDDDDMEYAKREVYRFRAAPKAEVVPEEPEEEPAEVIAPVIAAAEITEPETAEPEPEPAKPEEIPESRAQLSEKYKDELRENFKGEVMVEDSGAPAEHAVGHKTFKIRKVEAPRIPRKPAKEPAAVAPKPDKVGAELESMAENAPTINEMDEKVGDSEDYVQSVSGGVEGSFAHVDEFDETDVNLMVAFGMEDELKEKIGDEKAKEITEKFARQATDIMENSQTKKITELNSETEYNSRSKLSQIVKIYKSLNRSVNIRILLALIVLVVTALFENADILGMQLPSFLDRSVYPVVYILAGLQLVFFSVGCAFRSFFKGLGNLFKFKYSTESVYSLAVLLSTAYHIALCFFYSEGSIILFETPLVFMSLLAVILEKVNLTREMNGFRIISSKRPKYVLETLSGDDAELERKAFEDVLDEDSIIMSVKPAPFVTGFFERVRPKKKNADPLSAASVWIAFLITAAFVALGIVKDGSVYKGLVLGYEALSIVTPVAVLIGLALPAWWTAKKAASIDSAIIGDGAIKEFNHASVVSFMDRDIFRPGSIKVRSVKTFNSGRIDRVIYDTASIFSRLGGPLSDVFNIATRDMGTADDVVINKVVEGGIEAFIGRKVVYLGNDDFIRSRGYEPTAGKGDESGLEKKDGICVMHMVCDGELCARIYLKYTFDPEFEQVLEKLYKAGLCVGIRTLDPNINEKMLSHYIDLTIYPVKILRTDPDTEEEAPRAINSGIVSRADSRNLLLASALCDSVRKRGKLVSAIAVISVLLGLLYMAYSLFRTGTSAVPPRSIFVAAYHLVFFIISYLASVIGV